MNSATDYPFGILVFTPSQTYSVGCGAATLGDAIADARRVACDDRWMVIRRDGSVAADSAILARHNEPAN